MLRFTTALAGIEAMELEDPCRGTFTVSAWCSGSSKSGLPSYGFKIKALDRDTFLKREWGNIRLYFEGEGPEYFADVNIDKKSMWSGNCRELIHKKIGLWLLNNNLAPWELRDNPKNILIEHVEGRQFKVRRPPSRHGMASA